MLLSLISLYKFAGIKNCMKSLYSDKSKDLIFIRHAESNYNKAYHDLKKSIDFDNKLTWQYCKKSPQFVKVHFSQQLIDCSITQYGREQCQRAKQALKNQQIDLVLVSPYHRTLETCSQIFSNRKVRIQVHPLLAEALGFACDISNHTEEKINKFTQFNFENMQSYSDFWFIDIQSEEIKKECQKYLTNAQLSFNEKQLKILQLLQHRKIREYPLELRKRIEKIKQILRIYKQKYKKIAVVSHYQTLRTLLTKQFNEKGKAIGLQDLPNATPLYLSIEELLSPI